MDESLIKYQHDKKLKALEKQVEYFRSQALRLKSEREGSPYSIEFVQTIETLKEKLDACTLEKKYFETFMIESRKENKELREKIHKGDKDIIERIKHIAKTEAASKKTDTDREKIASFQAQVNVQHHISELEPPKMRKVVSSQEPLSKPTLKNIGVAVDAQSRIINSNLEM